MNILEHKHIQNDEIQSLKRIAEGFGIEFPGEEFSNDELLKLGIGYGVAGPLSDEQVRSEAAEILHELEAAAKEGPRSIRGEALRQAMYGAPAQTL